MFNFIIDKSVFPPPQNIDPNRYNNVGSIVKRTHPFFLIIIILLIYLQLIPEWMSIIPIVLIYAISLVMYFGIYLIFTVYGGFNEDMTHKRPIFDFIITFFEIFSMVSLTLALFIVNWWQIGIFYGGAVLLLTLLFCIRIYYEIKLRSKLNNG